MKRFRPLNRRPLSRHAGRTCPTTYQTTYKRTCQREAVPTSSTRRDARGKSLRGNGLLSLIVLGLLGAAKGMKASGGPGEAPLAGGSQADTPPRQHPPGRQAPDRTTAESTSLRQTLTERLADLSEEQLQAMTPQLFELLGMQHTGTPTDDVGDSTRGDAVPLPPPAGAALAADLLR
jgi:hypothetical protein